MGQERGRAGKGTGKGTTGKGTDLFFSASEWRGVENKSVPFSRSLFSRGCSGERKNDPGWIPDSRINWELIAMKIDLQQRYELSESFFSLEGSVVMKLSADAAAEVCERASQLGFFIARIEGGIWNFPGFEARLDCIWDSVDVPIGDRAVEENNLAAAEFIRSERKLHDAFIVTTSQVAI